MFQKKQIVPRFFNDVRTIDEGFIFLFIIMLEFLHVNEITGFFVNFFLLKEDFPGIHDLYYRIQLIYIRAIYSTIRNVHQ